MRRFLITIVVLAAAGVAVSSYALWQHYAPLGSAFCNLGERFSCDLVNKSDFSEVAGVPVAGIGIAGYLALGAFALGVRVDAERARAVLPWIFVAAASGLAFSLYLTYLEFFVIGAICALCVTSQSLILGITGVAGYATYRERRVRATDTA